MVLASPALACSTPTLLSTHHHHHVNRCSSCCLLWRYVYVFVSAQLTHFRNFDIIFFCLAEIYCCTIIRYRGSLPLQGSRMTRALQGTASLLALSKGFAFAVIHHSRRTHQSSYDCVRYLYLPPNQIPFNAYDKRSYEPFSQSHSMPMTKGHTSHSANPIQCL